MGRQIATSSGYRAEPLLPDLNWGAQVLDLDPLRLTDAKIRKSLRDLWIREGVIVFRKLEGVETHLTLSEIFGPLWVEPISNNVLKDRKELIDVRLTPDDGWLTEVDGDIRNGYLHWHMDLIHTPKINHGGILCPVKLTSRLGQTGFIDKISAYETLPADLKARIEELHVIYRHDIDIPRFGRKHKFKLIRYSANARRINERTARKEYPDVLHPMVFAQPETGRKVLNVSPWFAMGIFEMPNAEGDDLLERVAQHIADEKNAYFHQWRQDDMVLWDNWRLLHLDCRRPTGRGASLASHHDRW